MRPRWDSGKAFLEELFEVLSDPGVAPAPPGRRLGSEPKSHLPARCGEHTARVLGKLFAPGMATIPSRFLA
jgi:hypothetical protein